MIPHIKTILGHQDIWHEKHKQSDILRSVQLKTFRQTECDLIYGGMGDVKKEHLCAYYEGSCFLET